MKITAQDKHFVSLAEIKAHLRVEHDEENPTIARYIDTAVTWFESVTGVFLRPTTHTFRFTESPVELVTRPFTSLTSSVDDDAVAITTTTTEASGGVTVLEWDHVVSGAATVVWVSGYTSRGAIPETNMQAVRCIVGSLYVDRQLEQPVALHKSAVPMGIFLGESRVSV